MQGPARIAQIWLAEQEINGVPCSQSSFCYRELSRNCGHIWGPGEALGCTEMTLELETWNRGHVFLPHPCSCSSSLPLMCSLMNGALGDKHVLVMLPGWCAGVYEGWGRGYHWLKGLSPGLRRGLGESSREQPDLRRVRCISLKIHNPSFLGKLSQPSPI